MLLLLMNGVNCVVTQMGQVKPEDISDDDVLAVAEVLRPSTQLVVSEAGFQVTLCFVSCICRV